MKVWYLKNLHYFEVLAFHLHPNWPPSRMTPYKDNIKYGVECKLCFVVIRDVKAKRQVVLLKKVILSIFTAFVEKVYDL